MKYYWKNGFYIDEIHFDFDPATGEYTIPAGYIEITEELYHNLLDGQAAGKRIVTGADGLPAATLPRRTQNRRRRDALGQLQGPPAEVRRPGGPDAGGRLRSERQRERRGGAGVGAGALG